MVKIPKNKNVILFDGVCNLCNTSVNQVIKYDQKNLYLFCALQSETGKKLTSKIGIETEKIDSIILYEPGVSYDIKSTAVLKIMSSFGGVWSLTKIFFILPESFRNFLYDFVARNRYKWYGKKESCRVPTPELKAKFLD